MRKSSKQNHMLQRSCDFVLMICGAFCHVYSLYLVPPLPPTTTTTKGSGHVASRVLGIFLFIYILLFY